MIPWNYTDPGVIKNNNRRQANKMQCCNFNYKNDISEEQYLTESVHTVCKCNILLSDLICSFLCFYIIYVVIYVIILYFLS
jgi:hypothetical protein